MKQLVPLGDRDYVIYLVTNTVNGKKYVGQTCKTLEERWSLHCWNAERNTGIYFASAIKKYGPESFLVEQLCLTKGRALANKIESFYIRHFDSMDREKGYNCTSGGDGGYVFSDLSREKLSKSQKALGRRLTPEQIEALRQCNLGAKRSPELGKKLSAMFRKAPTEDAHRLYLQGMTTYAVAEELGITQASVWKLLKFDGIETRPNRGETLPQFRKDLAGNLELKRLYEEEKISTTKLAVLYETKPGTILRHLRDMGVIIRSRVESSKQSRTQNFDISSLNLKGFKVKDQPYENFGKKRYWLCECECGYQQKFTTNDLKKGKVTSCEWHQKHPIPLR